MEGVGEEDMMEATRAGSDTRRMGDDACPTLVAATAIAVEGEIDDTEVVATDTGCDAGINDGIAAGWTDDEEEEDECETRKSRSASCLWRTEWRVSSDIDARETDVLSSAFCNSTGMAREG